MHSVSVVVWSFWHVVLLKEGDLSPQPGSRQHGGMGHHDVHGTPTPAEQMSVSDTSDGDSIDDNPERPIIDDSADAARPESRVAAGADSGATNTLPGAGQISGHSTNAGMSESGRSAGHLESPARMAGASAAGDKALAGQTASGGVRIEFGGQVPDASVAGEAVLSGGGQRAYDGQAGATTGGWWGCGCRWSPRQRIDARRDCIKRRVSRERWRHARL